MWTVSGGKTVGPPRPSCLRRELSSGQHTVGGGGGGDMFVSMLAFV